MRLRRGALASLLLALLAACPGCKRQAPSEPTPPTAGSLAPAAREEGATVADTREVAFGDGKVRFFAPASATGRTKLPFVLVLHGLGGSGSELVQALGLEAFARAKQFAFAAPDGTLDAQGRRFWNANDVCCNFQHVASDDGARLMSLVDEAISSLNADPERVFVVGYSNGGFMAHRLACEHASRIRAIVSISASGPGQDQRCEPAQPVAVLEIHGSEDAIVPFDGGHLFGQSELPRTPSVVSGLQVWARKAGCDPELRPFERRDLLAELPGMDSESFHFSGCSAASPTLWKIGGVGHVIPLGPPALEAIWEFLATSG